MDQDKTYKAVPGESCDVAGMARTCYVIKVLTLSDPVRKYSENRYFNLKLFFSSPKENLTLKFYGPNCDRTREHGGSKDKSEPSTKRKLLCKINTYIYHKSILAMTKCEEALKSQYC